VSLKDLDFAHPDELVATVPSRPTRVMWVESSDIKSNNSATPSVQPIELTITQLLEQFAAGDLLVLNNTRVIKRRVFTIDEDIEVLFVAQLNELEWEVLSPLRGRPLEKPLLLPGGIELLVTQRGLPQRVRSNKALPADYFEQFGEMPLPPYIRRVRGQSHTQPQDESWYQTAWAEHPGSSAAPTASLHFSNDDIQFLRNKGVEIQYVTLHVGLGTYLPVKTDRLQDHRMHHEWAEVPASTWEAIGRVQKNGRKVWALGTTAVRALESVPKGKLVAQEDSAFRGETDLFIHDDFEFKVVDRMLTNFHQPQSTLLALVASFAGLKKTMDAYHWAVEKQFRLFSYGDLSVWIRN
jgi:S-adenosylmethionine:tRNA ribosyltransferase-isomerase